MNGSASWLARLPGGQRVRQFLRAVGAKLTPADRAYVKAILPPCALPLFYAMHPADCSHVLHVCRTAKEMAAAEHLPKEQEAFLLRCALLHYAGRVKGDLDIMGKVFAVLMMHYLPSISERMVRPDAHHIWQKPGHALYVYRHHPAIGAAKLRAIGLMAEAAVIEQHHMPHSLADPPVLRILKLADEQN